MKPEERVRALRGELAEIDHQILEAVARRQSIATGLGRLKAAAGRPARDYGQEKEVMERARKAAGGLGLPSGLAGDLMLRLIRASLTAQERDRVQTAAGGGRRVLVIGGAGKMGRWLARFLASQGFAVEIADPAGPAGDFPHRTDWRGSPLGHDLVAVAAPLRASRTILEELAARRPPGVVFDVGSLKTPLRPGLRALAGAGVRVASIHPMFGPDTELLSGRHVILVDAGSPEATAEVRSLFDATMATLVEMDLDSHDRLIAYVLGLSHALNIAFFDALAGSGEAAPRLAELSSTTFDAQLDVSRRVAAENPHLYFEIQSLNDYGDEALAALQGAVERVRRAVSEGDEETFAEMMSRGHSYLRGLRREGGPDPR